MKKDYFSVIQKKVWLVLLLTVTACGTVKRGSVPYKGQEITALAAISADSLSGYVPDSSNTIISDDLRERQEILKLAYQDWKGIPYILGGTGYNGIDCSAFMQVVYEDYFSRMLPRTTLEQLQYGKPVDQRNVETGDMVFFKTGRRTYHVGIMMNDNDFLHASTTEGVTISDLRHPYWQESFLVFRRVL